MVDTKNPRSLDSLAETDLPGPIAFVKIDVQGYELAVCHGMRRVLAENARLAVAFEYAPEAMREMGQDPAALLDLFAGFRLHHLEKSGRFARASATELDAAVRRRGYTDVIALRRG